MLISTAPQTLSRLTQQNDSCVIQTSCWKASSGEILELSIPNENTIQEHCVELKFVFA